MPRKRAALTEEERREIRAERKRQRHLWQTGASDKEKKKALDIALGGSKYAWMTQPASIPNIPMPAAGGPKAPTPRKDGGHYQPHPHTPGSSSPTSVGVQSPTTPTTNPALSSPGTPPTPITPAALALPKVSQPASKQGTKRKRGTQKEPIVVSSREASPIVIPSRDGSPEPPQTPLAKKAKLTESSAAEDDLANELEAAFEEERLAKALEEAFEEELEPDDPANVDDDDDELARELESALEEDRLARALEEALEAPEDEEASDGNEDLAKELEAALEGDLDELFDEEVEEEDILAKELEEACAEDREKDELYHVLEHAWAFLTL